MKKLMILSIMISLFAFWGSKNEVNKVHAEEVVQENKSSATFFASNGMKKVLANCEKMIDYKDSIVSIKISNDQNDLNSYNESNNKIESFKIDNCTYTDASGNIIDNPSDDIVMCAYISESNLKDPGITQTLYDCVLYANVENIYSNEKSIGMFFGFTVLKTIDLSKLDTSKTTDMSRFFYNCSALINIILGEKFITDNVTSMSCMFYGCSNLSLLDLSNFKTDNVTSMDSMFYGCSKLNQINLSNITTTNITVTTAMFQGCSNLTEIDISSWDIKNVYLMNRMFKDCIKLENVVFPPSDRSPEYIQMAEEMFSNCSSLKSIDLSSLKLNSLISGFLDGCTSLEYIKCPKDLGNIPLSLPAQFTTYCGVSKLTKDNLSQYSEISLLPETGTAATVFDSNTHFLFLILIEYYLNIVTIKVTNSVIDLPLESERVCDPIKLEGCTYTDASGVPTTPAEGVIFAYLSYASDSTDTNKRYNCVLYADVEKIYANQNSTDLFGNFNSLENIDIKILDTSKTTNMSGFFKGCNKLKNIDVSSMNTSNATDMSYMFDGCSSLVDLNLSNFDTRNAENMFNMFNGCSSLTELNVSSFITTKVTNMAHMFSACSSLTELNVSNLNTSNVISMNQMFRGCSSLKNINLSNFDTSKVKGMDRMFMECSSLIELDLYNFDTSNVESVLLMFNSCTSLKSINLSSFDLSKAMDLKECIINCPKLEYIKSPSVLPAKSTTDESCSIKLPTQFSPYSDITALTADNLANHKIIILPGDKFVYEWKNLRTEGGENGICNAIPSTSTGNDKLTQLLSDYDNFDTETKEYVDKATDKDNVTVGESVAYVKNVLNGTQTTENDYGVNKEDSGSYMTMSVTEESPYLIATISLLGVLAVLSYYFYNKKKQTM